MTQGENIHPSPQKKTKKRKFPIKDQKKEKEENSQLKIGRKQKRKKNSRSKIGRKQKKQHTINKHQRNQHWLLAYYRVHNTNKATILAHKENYTFVLIV